MTVLRDGATAAMIHTAIAHPLTVGDTCSELPLGHTVPEGFGASEDAVACCCKASELRSDRHGEILRERATTGQDVSTCTADSSRWRILDVWRPESANASTPEPDGCG